MGPPGLPRLVGERVQRQPHGALGEDVRHHRRLLLRDAGLGQRVHVQAEPGVEPGDLGVVRRLAADQVREELPHEPGERVRRYGRELRESVRLLELLLLQAELDRGQGLQEELRWGVLPPLRSGIMYASGSGFRYALFRLYPANGCSVHCSLTAVTAMAYYTNHNYMLLITEK